MNSIKKMKLSDIKSACLDLQILDDYQAADYKTKSDLISDLSDSEIKAIMDYNSWHYNK